MNARNNLRGAVLFLLVSPLAAQIPCDAANDQSTSVSAGIYGYLAAAPNRVAWQITPSSVLTVMAAQIFSGNQNTSQVGSFMTLEIFDESPAALPGNRLAGGTWKINPAVGWQGANLDQTVVMLPATNYWIVWTEPGWSTVPVEPGGTTMPNALFWPSTGWTSPVQTALKYRLFCSLLEGQGAVPFGPACASTAGAIGTAFTNQLPSVGNTAFRLEGTGFPASSLALLVIGVNPQFPSVPVPGTLGCWLNNDATITLAGATGSGNVRAATAFGHTTFNIPLPANPALAGFYFASQVAAFDVGSTAALPFVTSNSMQITLF